MQTDRDNNMVAHDSACPKCGERDMDRLIWIDDDRVRCATCGHVYEPALPATGEGGADDRA